MRNKALFHLKAFKSPLGVHSFGEGETIQMLLIILQVLYHQRKRVVFIGIGKHLAITIGKERLRLHQFGDSR